MKISERDFRGRAPRISPRALPPAMAQEALNARLLSGDLEPWKDLQRQFVLPNPNTPINTIFQLNADDPLYPPSPPVPPSPAWRVRLTLPIDDVLSFDDTFTNWYGIPVFGGGIYMLYGSHFPNVGNAFPLSITSTDAITWQRNVLSTLPANFYLEQVCYGDGKFVGVCEKDSGNTTGIVFVTSVDGVTWAAGNDGGFTPNAQVRSIAHNGQSGANSLFVAIGLINSTTSAIATSPDGITWTQQGDGGFTLPNSGFKNDRPLVVAHNKQAGANGLWIAKSDLSLRSSPDGITWTLRTTPAEGSSRLTPALVHNGQAAPDGLWVTPFIPAAGPDSRAFAVSSDGVTWSQVSMGLDSVTNPDITGLAHNQLASPNGLWIAIINGGVVNGYNYIVSPDGLTWMPIYDQALVPYGGNPGMLGYGNGKFFGRYYYVDYVFTYSVEDVPVPSVVWTPAVLPDDSAIAVAYGNGTYVAVCPAGGFGPRGQRVYTSPDGIVWTQRACPESNNWSSIAFGNGVFVAIASSLFTGTHQVMTSPDGITWTPQTAAASHTWSDVTFGAGQFVAVAGSGDVMTSPDGVTWTARVGAGSGWVSVTFGDGLYVAVGQSGVGNRVMTSTDGITWTLQASAADHAWTKVVFGNGLFVATSRDTLVNQLMTSPDGIVWTSRSITDDTGVNGTQDKFWDVLAFGNGKFRVIGDGTINRSAVSTDGINWTLEIGPPSTAFSDMVYGGGKFVAVTSGGYFYFTAATAL